MNEDDYDCYYLRGALWCAERKHSTCDCVGKNRHCVGKKRLKSSFWRRSFLRKSFSCLNCCSFLEPSSPIPDMDRDRSTYRCIVGATWYRTRTGLRYCRRTDPQPCLRICQSATSSIQHPTSGDPWFPKLLTLDIHRSTNLRHDSATSKNVSCSWLQIIREKHITPTQDLEVWCCSIFSIRDWARSRWLISSFISWSICNERTLGLVNLWYWVHIPLRWSHLMTRRTMLN